MVHIKICGLTRLEDIRCINQYPIAYAGFVFAKSSRQVTLPLAKKLVANLTHAKSVAVFVNEDIHHICEIATTGNFDILQLHGEETQEMIQYLKQHTNCEIWKALRIQSKADLRLLHELQPDRFLLDTYDPMQYGGSGKEIQYELLEHVDLHTMLLAGGIRQQNVKQKLALQPFGIDISSGVETNGVKDPNKIAALMKEVNGK